MPLIGSHATTTRGLATGGLGYADEVGAEVIQVFVSNPRGWAASAGPAAEDAALRESAVPVFVHATYMINLGSGNPEVAARSADAIGHALRRGAEIGARGVVVHTGSAAGWAGADSRDQALAQIGELVLPLLDKLGDDDPDLLFEPMAGQGQMLCARAGDLAGYLAAVECHPKAGVCLDTCHVFAAGHDLTAPGGVAAMLSELEAAAGPARVRLVHANDSLLDCGSKRDRHETIGSGKIGLDPFRDLLTALADVPFVVETPGGKAGHARDIATLKGLRDEVTELPRRFLSGRHRGYGGRPPGDNCRGKGAGSMVVVMTSDASASDVDHVVSVVRDAGGEAFVSRGESRTIIGLSGDIERFAATLNLTGLPGVADVVRISVPYKLVSREHRRDRSVIRVAGVPIGPDTLTVIAGPCAVETPEQTLAAANMARAAGASLLRGGAFKPRSSPYAFQGLGEAGLKILAEVRAETGLPIVTEVIDQRDVDLVSEYADMLQVGTRNMQNFPLLQAVGAAGKPVMLKRGMSATIEEWLMAAEYIAQRGNLDIVLCERGIRTFEKATRNTLDISAVPVVQRLSHLPVIVDPSHSGGRRDLVLPLSRAAIAVGADGIIVDVHPSPETALCDGPQALIESDLRELASVAHHLSPLVGRTLTPAPARTASPA